MEALAIGKLVARYAAVLPDSYVLEGVPPAYAQFARVENGCVVRLVVEGLEATTKFWQDDGFPLGTGPYGGGVSLAAFLDDLAENWRGWEGTKDWSDFENTISIHAQHDGLGHVTLMFEMRQSLYDGWKVVAPLPLEAGSLQRVASAARRFDLS